MDREVFNRLHKKNDRRRLRHESTDPERILWQHLRARQIIDTKFRRQQGIGEYIVDFYCPELKLVIEVDGDSHYDQDALQYDKRRDEYFLTLKIRTIRFTNLEVCEVLDGVLSTIEDTIRTIKAQ